MRHAKKTIRPEPSNPSELVARLDRTAVPRAGSPLELRIGILLWPRFPLLSLAGLCDALRHAADVGDQSRPVRCSWTVLGLADQTVEASCGVAVPVQRALDHADPADFDYVAVIGGLLPALDSVDRRYLQFLRATDAAGIPLAGICTGSFALAAAGLMAGRTACVHPFHTDDWQRMFPALAFVTQRDYLVDGDRITCAGGISIIELAAELVRRHCGADRAAKVVHQMTVARSAAASQISRRHALGYASLEDGAFRQAIVLMEKNIETPLEVAVIARLVGISVRQLERCFVAGAGMAPSEFYRNLRLKYGRWLLTSSHAAVGEVAYQCGFSDASHFIRHFQRLYGVAPGRLRLALKSNAP